jgi:hypothetical protein
MNHIVLAFTIPILFFTLFIIKNFPLEKEEIKKTYNYIEQNISKKDKIYVYYASVPAFNFYADINKFNLTNEIIFGKNCRQNIYQYTDDLINVNDPIWMLFTHYRENEKMIILDYMIKNGYSVKDKKLYFGAEILYLDKL